MRECCENCARCFDLEKFEWQKPFKKMDGYICMAFAEDRTAVWIVGEDRKSGMCEMYSERRER